MVMYYDIGVIIMHDIVILYYCGFICYDIVIVP
jgi:hypothetical protein